MRMQVGLGYSRLLFDKLKLSLLDVPEVVAACGPRPHFVQTSEYEVRSTHRLFGGTEQAPSLNTYFASALVCTPATSLGDAWVRTGRWRNVLLRKSSMSSVAVSMYRGYHEDEFCAKRRLQMTTPFRPAPPNVKALEDKAAVGGMRRPHVSFGTGQFKLGCGFLAKGGGPKKRFQCCFETYVFQIFPVFPWNPGTFRRYSR